MELLAQVQHDLADFLDFYGNPRMALRLLFATALGGILGWQRESIGKEAGLRNYMTVALSSAFITSVVSQTNFTTEGVSRVLQGLLTGIGFLGAGTILKRPEKGQIEGLTTAAGIWLTAVIGVAAGMGRLGLATIATIFAFAIFQLFAPWAHEV